jgi:hypothetical protein
MAVGVHLGATETIRTKVGVADGSGVVVAVGGGGAGRTGTVARSPEAVTAPAVIQHSYAPSWTTHQDPFESRPTIGKTAPAAAEVRTGYTVPGPERQLAFRSTVTVAGPIVGEGVAEDVGVVTRRGRLPSASNAPMSQPGPCGRVTPR